MYDKTPPRKIVIFKIFTKSLLNSRTIRNFKSKQKKEKIKFRDRLSEVKTFDLDDFFKGYVDK